MNDTATMLLMGASPFQILASQGGQVVQALGDGPQGVKGSLTAIGSSIAGFARSIPAAGYAVAGVTAAVGALYYLTKGPSARTAEESIKLFETAVRRLEDGWKGASVAAEEHFQKAQRSLNSDKATAMLDTQAEVKKLRQDYQAQLRDLNSNDTLPEQILRARSGAISPAHQQIRELYGELLRGKITATQMSTEMQKIRLDPEADAYARSFADAIRLGIAPAVELQQRIEAIVATAAQLGGKGSRVTSDPDGRNPFDLRDRFGGVTGAAGRLDPSSMDGVRDQLRSQRAEFETYIQSAEQAQRELSNFDLSPVQRQIAETTQEYDRQITALQGTADAAIGIAALQAEKEAALGLIRKQATRDEETRRAGYALDLAAINDVTAAQKAATAGQRAYNDAIAAGYGESYARERQAEASALTLAQARQQLSEAGRQQELATQRQIEQAQLEYDLVGKSASEVARLRTEFDLLAQAKDAARAAGFDEAQVQLTDEMRRQAAEVGRLTEATQRLNFERDLLFDRQQATRSPEDQRIAEQLRAIGVDFESAQGRADAAQLRLNERLHKTNDALYEMRDAGKEAFLDLVDAIGSGENAIQSIARALAGFGRQFASAGLDKITDMLFGKSGGASSGSSGGGLLGAIGTLAGGVGGTPRVVANQNAAFSGSSVPAPTPAMRATSSALAQTVTQSVSSNLLTSMLGAGKNRSHISGMNKEFAAALTNMFEAAPKAVQASLTINSGFRSVARQAELFDAALKKYGSVAAARKWVAPPGNSQHNNGMAADLGYGNVSARQWVHQNAGKYGLAFPLGHENWHIELAGARGGNARVAANDQRVLAKGVSQGLEDYQRKLGGPESYTSGRFDPATAQAASGSTGGLMGLLKSPFGQGAMNALGAFGAGASGGPFSGALSGGLGAIGMGLGPMGIVAGAPVGAMGPLFKSERKAA
ncbi:D-alanyl-D-alanine carboxypeptidase family protein [Aureimonas phyllosphaerae]|uniref:D-alanyl-D-alanine carboxypeptidase family protein n=1 Tax=Aureimonas phyllosphaerae TaxID=1166078 RepID=UPI001FCD9247|nr:D-alanyl-D-alanine carboxypeptidase family protein [Aureimonas phyllosphaerae]